jgi:hypothetical protein
VQARVFETEKKVEEKFDIITQNLASKMGMKEIPWFRWTYYLTILYSMVTCLVLVKRSDFFNVTLCCVSIYML